MNQKGEPIKKRVSQVRLSLAACRELAGDYNKLPKVWYVSKHKT